MQAMIEVMQSELQAAILHSDPEAIKRLGILIGERFEYISEIDKMGMRLDSDIRLLAETMKRGFDDVNKRFEEQSRYMEQRFEDINKRFEDQLKYMDKRLEEQSKFVEKRFEDQLKYMDRRFDDANKRFDDVNKRFDDVNRRFDMMFRFMSLGFSIITILIVVFKFVR